MAQSLVDRCLQRVVARRPMLSTTNSTGATPRNGTRSSALSTELVVTPLTGFAGEANAGWLLLLDTARCEPLAPAYAIENR